MENLHMDDTRGIGDNRPPETLADELAEKYGAEIQTANELLDTAQTAPNRIEDEETQTKVAELIKKMRTVEKRLDDARDAEKAPYAEKVSQINGYFKTFIEKLEATRKALNVRSKDFLDRKAEAERLRLKAEEDERRRRAEEAQRLAQDAERTKNEARAAAESARRMVEEAEAAKAAATTDQEIASAELAEAKSLAGKVKAEMLAKSAAFAQLALAGTPASDEEKAAARAGFEQRIAAAKEQIEAAEERLRDARERAMAARREQERQAAEARAAEAAARAAQRQSDSALNEAVREEKAADKIATKAAGPDADLARTRSLHGAVSTLQRRWTCQVIDRNALDKDALWQFINGDAIEAALWKWMMAQTEDKRRMAGALIEQVTEGQTR